MKIYIVNIFLPRYTYYEFIRILEHYYNENNNCFSDKEKLNIYVILFDHVVIK